MSNSDYEKLVMEMDSHIKKAWKSLAGYKFLMFGYHAASWVNLKKLHPYKTKVPNPFKALVNQAKGE